jgi:transcription antitermination factor NusG
MKMAGNTQWYAVRVNSQSQRMAKKVESEDFPVRRLGESVLERECREEGLDVYMPAFWTMQKHRRKNTIIEKRYPLFVGYAFVMLTDKGFESARQNVPSIVAFLRPSRFGDPVRFSEGIIAKLMLDEFESRQAFLFEKHQKSGMIVKERERELKNERKSVNHRISSATRRRKDSLSELARMQMEGMLAEDKARVQAIERELKGLENYDESLANYKKAG